MRKYSPARYHKSAIISEPPLVACAAHIIAFVNLIFQRLGNEEIIRLTIRVNTH